MMAPLFSVTVDKYVLCFPPLFICFNSNNSHRMLCPKSSATFESALPLLQIAAEISPVLESMRLHYPRLHFVSDRALLEGLALTGQPSELPRSLMQGVLTGLVGFEIRNASLQAEDSGSTAGKDGDWTLGSETGGSEREGPGGEEGSHIKGLVSTATKCAGTFCAFSARGPSCTAL